MNNFVVVYPPELDQLDEIASNTVFIGYNPSTGKMVRIFANVVYGATGYPLWDPEDEYDTDVIVVYQLRFWKSLIDNNIGNIPTEGANWTEVSASEVQSAPIEHWRGNYDASTNLFPATGGAGIGGAILAGDEWVLSVAGNLNGEDYPVGTIVKSLVNAPGQIATNWRII